MTVTNLREGSVLTLIPHGRIDTVTSPIFEAETEDLGGVTELILDFSDVTYISSAGLRVVVKAQKRMLRQGSMKLIHVSEEVTDVLAVTGMIDILTIE